MASTGRFCRSPVRATPRFPSAFTPYAPATVEYTRQIAGQNTPLVAITDSPFSPLVFNASVWFEVVESDFEGFRSLGRHDDACLGAGRRRRRATPRRRKTEFAFRLNWNME